MQTIGFFGLGLIGGSLAKALRRANPDLRILACSRSYDTLTQAISEGVIDEACAENDPRFSDCNYIFLCAPVEKNRRFLTSLKALVAQGCIISDVGSVKGAIAEEAISLGLSKQFIGGHPMAGSERTGLTNADAALFENAYYFLTPSPDVEDAKVEKLVALIKSIRALPIVTEASLHDYVVASVSHVPHIVAASLVNLVRTQDTEDELMKLVAAGGFRDITRIASSSPEMWEQICLSNGAPIARSLSYLIGMLDDLREKISSADGATIHEAFETAKDYRDSLLDSTRGALAKSFVLYIDLLDEAGGIATVTTLLAMNQINIKNIGIIHNREFEEGVLRIEFYDADALDLAETVLKKRNYTIRKRS